MHFDKLPKEKPCCTLPTVKKLLEQKRRRETSSVLPSCSTASTSPAPQTSATLPSSEPFPCTGASSSYSDMAVSFEPWTGAPESSSYFSSLPGSSFSTAYSHPVTTEYTQQQQLHELGETMPQTYTEFPMLVSDTGMSSPWSFQDHSQTTQLSFGPSIDANKLEEARRLVRGMDDSRATRQDEDGDTILHIYTAKGLRECAFAAAERLRNVGRLDAKEHKGKTALLVAVTANQPEIVQDLLTFGADINACEMKGQTALHLAAHYGLPGILQVILSSRPDVNLEAHNFEGMTPLHCAAISHSLTIKALSSSTMTDVSLITKAAEKLSCVQMLLNSGASLLSKEIKSNKTVLHLAVKEGNIDLVGYLLKIPLQNMKDFVNLKAHGHTALHMAAGLHSNPYQAEILRLLLSRGADPSIRNLENDQPAHLLQSGPQGEQLKLMLKKRNASSRRRNVSLQDRE